MKKILAILVMLAALLASCDGKNPEIRNNVASYSIYVGTIREIVRKQTNLTCDAYQQGWEDCYNMFAELLKAMEE